MPNSIDKIAVVQSELDVAAVEGLTSSWMELNDRFVKYEGGREIKIGQLTTDGLADYDRQKGFVEGSVNLVFKTHEMTQDRGRLFTFDEHDVGESNFLITASAAMGVFQNEHVIPEVDAYRYSYIASKAMTNNRARGGYTPSADDILSQLYQDVAEVEDAVGSGNIVIVMSRKVATLLDLNKETQRNFPVIDFHKYGNISMKVKSLDGEYPIMRVGSDRMKTTYEFKNGKTGQETGGFVPAGSAKNINWLIVKRSAPIAVCKTDKMRVFTPDTNQKGRMWQVDYRKYHDIWIPEKKMNGIFANIKESL